MVIVLAIFFISVLKGNPAPMHATLQFWGTYDDETFYSDVIRAYRQKNPNLTIEYRQIPFADYENTLVSAFAAGNGPDLFLMHNTWLPKHYDLIQPIPQNVKTPIMAFKDFQSTFVDVATADLTSNGQIYGMPLYVDTLAMYYNKDTFNTAGISSPPRTWEDFVQDVAILTKRDDRNNITKSAVAIGTARNINRSTDLLGLLMLQSGVRMTDGNNATFSKPVENLNVGELALQFYTDFANSGKPDRYTWNDQQKYSIDAFADGNTAMLFNYSHQIPIIRGKAPRLHFGIAPMPQPGQADRKVNYANYWAPTVSKQSRYGDDAWKFLVFLATDDTATLPYLQASGRPAARKDLIEREKNDPDLGTFATQALTAFSWQQPDNVSVESIFAKLIDDVNFNHASIHDSLQEAEAQVNVIMSKNRQ